MFTEIKPKDVLTDSMGNYFAVDKVVLSGETYAADVTIHSVVTKEQWTLPLDFARLQLQLVPGLREA